MREPTQEDRTQWATTPIATVTTQSTKEDGTIEYTSTWQRFKKSDGGMKEILEGVPKEFHLTKTKSSQYVLTGVEDNV